MKRWRRIILITAIALLITVLGLIGTLAWLQSSGRLTQYAQDLVRERSGQHLSFDAVSFTSWNAIALTQVHLEQALPGWQLDVQCPRVEVRYTWWGLSRKHIAAVHLIQPTVNLKASETPLTSNDRGEVPAEINLPVDRIHVRDATLRVHRQTVLYAFRQIEADVRYSNVEKRISLNAQATFDDDVAHIHIKGSLSNDVTHPTGTFDVGLRHIDASQLTEKGIWPSNWTLTEGILNVTASQVELRGHTLQGPMKINLEQGHGDIAAVTVQGAEMTTDLTVEADLAIPAVTLQGTMQLQAATVRQESSGLVAAQPTAQLPVKLTYAPDQWHIYTDLRLQVEQLQWTVASGMQLQKLSHTASLHAQSTPKGWSLVGELAFETSSASIASIQLKQLSGKTPVDFSTTAPGQWHSTVDVSLQSQTISATNAFQLQAVVSRLPLAMTSTSPHWMVEGTAELQAHRLQVKAVNPAFTGLVFDRVQSQIPIRLTAVTLASSNLYLQAQTVRWQPDTDTTIASPMDLRSTLHIHLQRQQIDAENLVIDLSTLGRLQGSGAWRWTTKTAQEVHLALVPTSLETVWPYVAPLLPAPYPAWQVTGLTQIELYTPSLAWDDGMATQPITLDWRFNHIAFSNAAGDVAGEHINGQIQADLSLTPNWRPASLQASLHLKPFALLIGSFFPEFENHHIEFNLTLNSTYQPKTNHIDLNIDGHFGPLGQMKIQGRLDPSKAPLQADVTCTLRQMNMQTAWQTFMPEAWRQATDPAAMEGLLNTHLQLRGNLADAHVRGDLQLAAFHLQMGSFNLRNLTLQLPIDVRYPLPQHLPDLAQLPASAYGRLQVGYLQFNGLQIPGITTTLALRSDSIIFQKDIQASLLKGVLHIQNLAAYHVLQPQRQLLVQMRLRALHLKDLQRRDDTLPVAGQIDADFSSLHFQHGRLQTQGTMQLRVAGGRIRIYDIAGWDLLSQIWSIRCSLKTEEPLSLQKLTQIYPIGAMGGTLHVTVDDLTVTAGEPAAFRLHFQVQHQGGEERQISFRALNNLLFTTGSTRVAASFTDKLPYRRFGAEITLQHDILRLRGLYKDGKGREYFMRAPALGSGISIVNERPQNNSIAFRSFVQRLKSTVLEGPDVNIK